MYNGKKVSLVLPAYNEEEIIGATLREFRKLGIFDEIIVVDNNSNDQTAKIAKITEALVIRETKQGYGFALTRGLRQASGDYIMMSEPDGTFLAKDALHLLSYIQNFDMVTGTRTNKKYIDKNAHMGSLLRFGNILVSKLIQLLFGGDLLSDCGCTFRVMNSSLVKKILPKITVGGAHFLPELVILTKRVGGSIFEIPIRYKKRVGKSKITGSLKRAIIVGIRMIILVFAYRFNLK